MELNWREFIESDPKILFGKRAIQGNRIPVDLILEKLSRGESIEQLLSSYPQLDKKNIFACLSFAAETVKNEIVISEA